MLGCRSLAVIELYQGCSAGRTSTSLVDGAFSQLYPEKSDRLEATPQSDAARISEDFHAAEWTASPRRAVRRLGDPFRSNYLRLQPVGVAGLVGSDEPQLHAALLLPAFGVLCGTSWPARSFCRQRVSAAIAVMVIPVFLVSRTNLRWFGAVVKINIEGS
jgi:hypothetical protein